MGTLVTFAQFNRKRKRRLKKQHKQRIGELENKILNILFIFDALNKREKKEQRRKHEKDLMLIYDQARCLGLTNRQIKALLIRAKKLYLYT